MTDNFTMDRRAFLVRGATVAGALTLGFRIPFDEALAAELVNPELFLMWRANGLRFEAPAVRP